MSSAQILKKKLYLPVVDSTNNEAKRRIQLKQCCPKFIIAKQQTKGRGRYGKIWFSSPGNLFFSFLEETDMPTQQQPILVGLCVCKAIQLFLKERVSLKYPNDIYIHGKKVGGILIDRLFPIDVIGIGVNIKSTPMIDQYETTCLSLYTKDVSINFLTGIIMKYYNKYKHYNFSHIREKWLERCDHINQIISPKYESMGKFIGLDDQGFPKTEAFSNESVVQGK